MPWSAARFGYVNRNPMDRRQPVALSCTFQLRYFCAIMRQGESQGSRWRLSFVLRPILFCTEEYP